MDRFLVAILFTFFVSFDASANRYFQRVPLEQAHLVYGQPSGGTFNPDSIKVLVWNIKKASEPEWKKEFESYATERDLFLLQEAYPNLLFSSTLAGLGEYQWDMGISFRYVLYDYLPTGTMIGSKVIHDDFYIKHSPDLEPVTETPKAVTFARYDDLMVVNVHGVNFTDHEVFVRHMQQIENELHKHHGAILIAGDFNTRTKERITYMYDMMKRLMMSEVKFENGNQRMRAKLTNNILDYAFVRGLEVKKAVVVGRALGSDHKPMLIEMAMR
jgi:endonuclease/exonuclease/phosphatase (EEP) superfamily protein YafD